MKSMLLISPGDEQKMYNGSNSHRREADIDIGHEFDQGSKRKNKPSQRLFTILPSHHSAVSHPHNGMGKGGWNTPGGNRLLEFKNSPFHDGPASNEQMNFSGANIKIWS